MNNNQVISLVTGGTRGIGSVIVDLLRKRGDQVITVSRRKLDDKDHISADLSSEKQISQISRKIKQKSINNLIFCHRYRGKNWKKEFLISLDAVYHMIESLKMNLASESSIVIISSNACQFIFDEQPLAYHATQAALDNLTRYYAVNLGNQGTRCNCVLPGGSLVKPENQDFFTKDNPVTKLIEDIRPIKKIGSAEDVANVVEFLCSDKSSFITAQTIFVDGGLSVVSQESLARKLMDLKHPNSL